MLGVHVYHCLQRHGCGRGWDTLCVQQSSELTGERRQVGTGNGGLRTSPEGPPRARAGAGITMPLPAAVE